MTNVTQGLTGRALGEAVIDHVLTHPEQHDQRAVSCGTSACLAGWTVALHLGLHSGMTDEDFFEATMDLDWYTGAAEIAPQLLGVAEEKFGLAVFAEFDRDTAISNLKHLMDEAGL
jgi:hypothetical protein